MPVGAVRAVLVVVSLGVCPVEGGVSDALGEGDARLVLGAGVGAGRDEEFGTDSLVVISWSHIG